MVTNVTWPTRCVVLVVALAAVRGGAWGQEVGLESDRTDVEGKMGGALSGTRRAIVVGLDAYRSPKLTPLRAADRDAKDVAQVLSAQGWLVRRMTMDDEGRRPLLAADVLQQVREVYASTKVTDTVLVYFSGHSLGSAVDGHQEDYLCVHETDPERLSETAIAVSALQRLLEVEVPAAERTHAAKTVLIVDASRDRARSSQGLALDRSRISRGHGVLFGTARKATAKDVVGIVHRWGNKVENGLLTHFLLAGLRGRSNENGDGYVTFRELSSWVRDQMRLLADEREEALPTPFFAWEGDASHDIVLMSAVPGLTWRRTNEQGSEEYTLDKDPSVVMILVPGGEFAMGLASTAVTLGSYMIGKYETTWAQYAKFCQETSRKVPERPEWGRDDHPVVNVSSSDAQDYCAWAGLRLPTETEWEYAVRGRDGRTWPWGGEEPTAVGRWCNLGLYPESRNGSWGDAADGYEHTSPVGSYPKGVGPFGTMDQAGNVWEWCSDWYLGHMGGASLHSPANRAIRGGSWHYGAERVRASVRVRYGPTDREDDLGFRAAAQVAP